MWGIFESLAILVLYIVLAAGVKLSKKGEFHEDFMSLKITKGLQGYAAVGIMLHHMIQRTTNYGQINIGPINIFNNVGYLFAGMFFFFSGYGLLVSLKTKPDYLKTFLRKRLPVIIIPYILVNVIFVIVNVLLHGAFTYEPLTPVQNILAVLGVILINTQLWFIIEIFFLYIIFYLVFRLIKNQNIAYVVMGVCVLVIITVSLLLGHDYESFFQWFKGEWWYNSTLLFFVGMTFAKFQDNILKAVKKHYAVYLVIGIIAFVGLFIAAEYVLARYGYYTETETSMGYADKVITCIVQTLTGVVGMLTFMILTMKCQFNNRVLAFLGTISMELYMIHNIFILTLTDRIKFADLNLYVFTIYACAILAAICLHLLDSFIMKKIRKN